MINVITVYEKMTDLKHLHIDTSQIWITFYHFQIWCYIITIIIELSHWFQRNPIFNCRLYSITTSLIICLKGRVRIVNIDIMYKNFQHSGPYKVFCPKKNTPGGIDVLLSIKVFFACKAIFIKQNMVLL